MVGRPVVQQSARHDVTVTLADQILPLVRTRTDLHRWRAANDYGSQLHDAVTLLQDAAQNEPPITASSLTSPIALRMKID